MKTLLFAICNVELQINRIYKPGYGYVRGLQILRSAPRNYKFRGAELFNNCNVEPKVIRIYKPAYVPVRGFVIPGLCHGIINSAER